MSAYAHLSKRERQTLATKMSEVFAHLDKNKDGSVDKRELQALFEKVGGFGKWKQSDFDTLFQVSDWNNDGFLSYMEFVDWILGVEVPQIYSRGTKKQPVHRTREIVYPSGAQVNVVEVQKDLEKHGFFKQLKEECPPDIGGTLRKFLYSREYNRTLYKFFTEADQGEQGVLEWNNKEIYTFCLVCFHHLDLPRPIGGDSMFHKLYRKFDFDDSWSLNERECLCMMDVIIRAIARGLRSPDDSSDDE
eukprot:TRINITY_DN67252_c1_g2_i1.p1 TRINITY_DN67252_c1_g2~~TRINITY_DN67252_c1_g2_i1.p1  ORF type:complete len:247 (+),score=46.17 TRINITY_DN67252_c1_g2_i1:69-809(+)